MRFLCLAIVALALAGCASMKRETRDDTKLEGPGQGDIGRELVVQVTAPPGGPIFRGETEAADLLLPGLEGETSAALEDGDLFDEVHTASVELARLRREAEERGAPSADVKIETKGRAHLDLRLLEVKQGEVHDFWNQHDAFVVRYTFDCELIDRSGTKVIEGRLEGLGWDDVTDLDKMNKEKRDDIRVAAQRDAGQKVARFLQRAAEVRAREAMSKLVRVKLPPGVGPVPVAALGFTDDEAAKRRRGKQLTRAVASALARLGPDLAIASQDEIDAELRSDPGMAPKNFENLSQHELDKIVPRIGARLLVVGRVSADGNRVEASASVKTTSWPPKTVGGTAHAHAEGPGALALVAVELARQIGAEIEKNPPDAVPRREENE